MTSKEKRNIISLCLLAERAAQGLQAALQNVENTRDPDPIQDDIADTLSAVRVMRSEVGTLSYNLKRSLEC